MMANRTNWCAWGLAVVLSFVVLTGSRLILTHGLRGGTDGVTFLPTARWQFGVEPIEMNFCGNYPPSGGIAVEVGWSFGFGFFKVWRLTGFPKELWTTSNTRQ
jgi:hypothetical protein